MLRKARRIVGASFFWKLDLRLANGKWRIANRFERPRPGVARPFAICDLPFAAPLRLSHGTA
jgi:hypothetical protein